MNDEPKELPAIDVAPGPTPAAIGIDSSESQDDQDPAPPEEPAPEAPEDEAKEELASSPLRSRAQFQDGPGPRARGHSLVPLALWRGEGKPLESRLELPRVPGLHVLRSADIRPIAAELRAVATPQDRALDLDLGAGDDDGHTLLQLLRLHLGGTDQPARLAIHPGTQGQGEEFWQAAARDMEEIVEQCRATGWTVFVAAEGPKAAAHLERHGLNAIEVDARPLIEALAIAWGKAAEQLGQIGELLDRGQLDPVGAITALDARDDSQLELEIEAATRNQPYYDEVATFIRTHILESAEPAEMAAAFTAVCFDELTSNEFRRIAQDLAETPDLVEVPAAKPDEVVLVPGTRVREGTLTKIGVRSSARLEADGTRVSLLVLRGAQRYRELLRRELPNEAIFTSVRFLEQMSARLVHGVVAPQRWLACCDVLGQTLVNEAGAAPELLGPRIAAFWLSAEAPPVSDPERARHIMLHGDTMLRRLCERAAELANIDVARLQAETAIALTRAARASIPSLAWRTPAAAAFVVQSLGAIPLASAEPLLQACIDGPPELLTLVCAGLAGGFGLTARSEADGGHLDELLATFMSLAQEEEGRSDSLQRVARGISWRLASIRLAADARRFAQGEPPTIRDTVAVAMVRYASAVAEAGGELFEELPFDASWIDENRIGYAALAQGWRAPPDYYKDPSYGRAAVLAAEFSFLATMRTLDALNAHRHLLTAATRRQAMGAFAAQLGFSGIPIDTVELWIPRKHSWPVEIDEGARDGHATGYRSEAAGLQYFRELSAQLRRAIPLLAAAFAHARMIERDGKGRIEVALSDSLIEAVSDKKTWSGLRTAADELRDMLDAFEDPWRDAIDTLPPSDQLRAAGAQGRLQRQIFSAWWSALLQARDKAMSLS